MPPHAHVAIMPGTIRDHGAGGKAPNTVSRHGCISPPPRCTWRRRVLVALVLAAPLAGCIVAPTGANGRWVGPLTPASGTCDPASEAVLLVSPREATFAPDEGVLLLHGHADEHGHVVADLRTTGFNHQPYLLAFTGDLRDGHIVGTYVTPRCRATVTLTRR